MYAHTEVRMTVHVLRGKRPGARLFLSAAIHGDEINGVEIIRRIINNRGLRRMSGTLIAIPVVNVYGFLGNTRYLPDGRDLNRSFPGSLHGSLASRMANTFMQEIVAQCSHGIDLHTGARHRNNLPHIRADLDQSENKRLARAFGVPLVINSRLRDGSLREAADERGVPVLLYEAGEALRFDEIAIRAGERGVINVMRALNMLPQVRRKRELPAPAVANATGWERAPASGVLRSMIPPGANVKAGDRLGVLADPDGSNEIELVSSRTGIVIGRSYLPLVHEGDALFHIADVAAPARVEQRVGQFHEHIGEDLTAPAHSVPGAAPES